MFMYLAFIIRLCTVYNNPLYQYNLSTLKIICLLTIIYAFTVCCLTIWFTKSKSYYGICEGDIAPFIAGLMAIYDMVLSIGTTIAFIRPIRILIKSIFQNTANSTGQNTKSDEQLIPLINISVKYSVLTSIASISTFLLMITIALGYTFAGPIDFFVNMVCMVLMTRYYNDGKYYERFCCGAIKCSNLCLGYCCGYYGENVINLEKEITGSDQVCASKTEMDI